MTDVLTKERVFQELCKHILIICVQRAQVEMWSQRMVRSFHFSLALHDDRAVPLMIRPGILIGRVLRGEIYKNYNDDVK